MNTESTGVSASADNAVLFGDITPSGKLPIPFPRSDHGTSVSAPEQYSRTALMVHYGEDIFASYGGYEQFGIEPLFPFGMGFPIRASRTPSFKRKALSDIGRA